MSDPVRPMARIKAACVVESGMSDLWGRRRDAQACRYRAAGIVAMRRLGNSTTQIGHAVGRHHTTVSDALAKVEARCWRDREFLEIVEVVSR